MRLLVLQRQDSGAFWTGHGWHPAYPEAMRLRESRWRAMLRELRDACRHVPPTVAVLVLADYGTATETTVTASAGTQGTRRPPAPLPTG